MSFFIVKVRASEVRTKSKAEILKSLEEFKNIAADQLGSHAPEKDKKIKNPTSSAFEDVAFTKRYENE